MKQPATNIEENGIIVVNGRRSPTLEFIAKNVAVAY